MYFCNVKLAKRITLALTKNGLKNGVHNILIINKIIKINQVMGVIIRQSVKGTLVNYLGVAIGFITTFFVLTHYLTAEEIGLTRVLVDAATLFVGFAQLGTSSSVIRFYPYFRDEEAKDHGFFFWSVVVPFVGFLLFLIVFFAFKQPIIRVFSDKSPLFVNYFRFIIPLSFFMLYQAVFEANANVLMRIVVPKFIREVGIRVCLLVIYLLYGSHHISLDGLVIGFCITYFLAALTDLFYLFSLHKVSFKPDFKYITKSLRRNFLLYTLFLVLAALAGTITPLLNSFFVSAKMGLAYTGIFAIANYIATVIEIPNRSLNAIVQPNLSQAVKDDDWAGANQLCKSVSLHQLLSSTFIFLLIWINIDVIFQILPNGASYEAGKSVVFILGLARLSNSTFSIAASPLGYSKYYYLSLVFTLLLTVSAIALNVWLIPKIGMNGAALASLLAYFIYFLFMLVLVKWKLKISIFSWAQLKVVAIIVALFLVNLLWMKTLTPLFLQLPIRSLFSSILDALIRSSVIAIAGIAATYYWHVSNDVNILIKKFLLKLKKR